MIRSDLQHFVSKAEGIESVGSTSNCRSLRIASAFVSGRFSALFTCASSACSSSIAAALSLTSRSPFTIHQTGALLPVPYWAFKTPYLFHRLLRLALGPKGTCSRSQVDGLPTPSHGRSSVCALFGLRVMWWSKTMMVGTAVNVPASILSVTLGFATSLPALTRQLHASTTTTSPTTCARTAVM